MGFDRWREARNEPKELDLVPIMNLMVVLIPFLMLGAAFYHVSVIPASLPALAEGTVKPPSEVKITAQLELDADGAMRLSASAADLSSEQLAAFDAQLAPTPKGADLDRLVSLLKAIKTQHPKSDTLLVLAEGDLPYQDLVAALDAARELPGATPEAPATPLFPVAVFSKKVTLPDAGVEADGGAGAFEEAAP